jgi:peroxiredoxin
MEGEDVRVLIVDVRNSKDETAELAEEYGLTMPVLLDDQDVSHKVYEIVYTPTTFIIDRRGRAVFRHVGFAEGQETMLEREIALLLQRD